MHVLDGICTETCDLIGECIGESKSLEINLLRKTEEFESISLQKRRRGKKGKRKMGHNNRTHQEKACGLFQ